MRRQELKNKLDTTNLGYKVWELLVRIGPENLRSILLAQSLEAEGIQFGPDAKRPDKKTLDAALHRLGAESSRAGSELRYLAMLLQEAPGEALDLFQQFLKRGSSSSSPPPSGGPSP